MIKFSAINDNNNKQLLKSDSANDDQTVSDKTIQPQVEVFSKEREEFRIMNLYKQALEYQMKSQFTELINTLEEILTSSIMKEIDLVVQLQVVEAASYKLLAKTYQKLNFFEDSFIFYQMAIKLNHQDINLWYGIGYVSEKLKYWENAVISYKNVLKINSCHWPSLDALIIILFALSEFEICIELCERALRMDTKYEGGIYILSKIFQFQPFLKTIYKELLEDIPNIALENVDEATSIKISDKVGLIRCNVREKRILQQSKDKIETVNFKSALKPLTWESLTKSVLKLFLHLKETNKLESSVNMTSLLQESHLKVPIIEEKSEEKDFEIMEDSSSAQKVIVNVNRITRNSSQLIERPEDQTPLKPIHYMASLVRMNILNEVQEIANQKSTKCVNLSKKQDESHEKDDFNSLKHKAKSLNDCGKEALLRFIQSFDEKNLTIIAIGYQLVHQLITKTHFAWSSELIDDYLNLSNLIKIHVSSQCDKTETEIMLSIKRTLFELEILVDRKQSELEGKSYKREFQISDFLSHQELDDLSDKIMKLQIYHADSFTNDLNKVQIRMLWLKYILSEMSQNEEEVNLTLEFIKKCIIENEIPVTLRPNCIHNTLITLKKVNDYMSSTFKSLKIESLYKMYKSEAYDDIIEKTDSIIGTVILPRDDYAEDVNNYLIHISFQMSCYHKKLIALLNSNDKSLCCQDYLKQIYVKMNIAFEEIINIMSILVDPKKKNYASLTDKQFGFLIENFFKVSEIIMSNATNLLKIIKLHSLNLVDLVELREAARFVIFAKEYFYYLIYHNICNVNVAHVWCLYEHFKCLEMYDPAKFNQSITDNLSYEMDLPPSLNFLSIIHDFLGSSSKCCQTEGTLLKLIFTGVTEYLEDIRPKFLKLKVYVANLSDVFSMFDQALYCYRLVLRSQIDKSRKPIDHGCIDKVPISLELMDLLLSYLEPERIPEIDSIKGLSISAELCNLLLEMINLVPETIFQDIYQEEAIREAIESESPLNFGRLYPCKYSKLFYLVADHYFKNNEFEKALNYYITNLRFTPVCFDSWAGIALIYYKRFELKFNMMDNSSETLDNEEVMKCLNSFNHAISLDPENLTILIERACFCYEVHSYASRIIKKSMTRDIRESFIKVCEILSSTMLELAKESYQMALDNNNYREDKEEKWLYHYMLSKCMEKSDENTIIDVLDNLKKSLNSLDNCGARYVRKVVLYTKIPYRAVEVVEVYYKYHASILKCLIGNQSSLLNNEEVSGTTRNLNLKDRSFKKIDHKTLLELQQRLISMNQSPFIVNVGKKNGKGGNKKRPNNKPSDDCPEPNKILRRSPSPENQQMTMFSIDIANIPPELRYEDVDDDCIIQEIILPNQPEDVTSVFERCVDLCKNAMEIVLQRLPLHYKAMYHLAYIFYSVPHLKDLEKSYEYLMGSCKTGKSTINGLFKDRKTSNFFSGVWRIPVADIDRYGSFAYHMYRSMNLLLAILRQLNNWNDLIHLTLTLRKSASSDKKGFLSEADRQMLLRKSMGHALCSVTEWLMKYKEDISKTDLLTIHTLYYLSLKQSQGIDKMRVILIEAFSRCQVAKDIYKQVMVTASTDSTSIENKSDSSDRSNFTLPMIEKVLLTLREGKK